MGKQLSSTEEWTLMQVIKAARPLTKEQARSDAKGASWPVAGILVGAHIEGRDIVCLAYDPASTLGNPRYPVVIRCEKSNSKQAYADFAAAIEKLN